MTLLDTSLLHDNFGQPIDSWWTGLFILTRSCTLMLGHAYLGAFHTRTYGAIAKRIVTILVLHSVLPIILYLRIGMDSFDRGFVGAGIAGLQPLNGLGENLTAPLYCCVRETPRRSEEALCSCSTRLQQDVSLGWKRRLLCGRPLPGSAEIHCPVPLCHTQVTSFNKTLG